MPLFARSPAPGDSFIYDGYALDRLDQRGLTKDEIDRVVKHPTHIEPSQHDPERWILTRTTGGRTIRVVVAPEDAHWVVVTAWEA